MPTVPQSEVKKKDYYVVRDNTTGNVISVIFPNGIQVGIPGVENFNSTIVIPNLSSAPANTTNALYAVQGSVYFNGSIIGSGVTVDSEDIILASQVFG